MEVRWNREEANSMVGMFLDDVTLIPKFVQGLKEAAARPPESLLKRRSRMRRGTPIVKNGYEPMVRIRAIA